MSRANALRALKRGHSEGQFPAYEERVLEVLVYMLMGSRSYINLRFARAPKGEGQLPEWCARTYRKFVRGGFAAVGRGPSLRSWEKMVEERRFLYPLAWLGQRASLFTIACYHREAPET